MQDEDNPERGAGPSLVDFVGLPINDFARAWGLAYRPGRLSLSEHQCQVHVNHRFLHERLGEEVVRSQRGRRPVSLLMLDLDDFKLVNDTFGHLFGDRVLTWAAEVIRSTLRASDIPARYGGDEFAVILPETDDTDARRAAERILEAFAGRPFVDEQRGAVPLAASVGIATFPGDGRTATDLIARADAALYGVKRSGGRDAAAASGIEAA
jgi:diguanylate cyclase (GGDEF)-like protein